MNELKIVWHLLPSVIPVILSTEMLNKCHGSISHANQLYYDFQLDFYNLLPLLCL